MNYTNKSCSSMQQTKSQHVETMNIVISVPIDAARLTVTAHMIDENIEPYKAEATFTSDEIRECRNDYLTLDPTDDAFALYVTTDYGNAICDIMDELNCSLEKAEFIYKERERENG